MFESFEHTADLGLRVEAETLDELFRDAARGLFEMIAGPVDPRVESVRLEFRLEAERLEWLLFDWLNELLFTFDTRRLRLGEFDVRVEGLQLRATARGRSIDAPGVQLRREVKAITYHGLTVARSAAGWRAELIVDI